MIANFMVAGFPWDDDNRFLVAQQCESASSKNCGGDVQLNGHCILLAIAQQCHLYNRGWYSGHELQTLVHPLASTGAV
jgi:hypothetical protein